MAFLPKDPVTLVLRAVSHSYIHFNFSPDGGVGGYVPGSQHAREIPSVQIGTEKMVRTTALGDGRREMGQGLLGLTKTGQKAEFALNIYADNTKPGSEASIGAEVLISQLARREMSIPSPRARIKWNIN